MSREAISHVLCCCDPGCYNLAIGYCEVNWVKKVLLYDTTLRDGAQQAGVSFSVEDKLKIARKLDELGIHYIEGGWPGSNPKDEEFFKRAREASSLAARCWPRLAARGVRTRRLARMRT